MPVEIRELQITAVIEDAGSQSATASSQPSGADNNQIIIEKCVEQVLEILKQKNER